MLICLRVRPPLRRNLPRVLAAAVAVSLMFAACSPLPGDTAVKGDCSLELKTNSASCVLAGARSVAMVAP